jgi:uncharacterized membrane protein YphA (DoxX/SURF4 family)
MVGVTLILQSSSCLSAQLPLGIAALLGGVLALLIALVSTATLVFHIPLCKATLFDTRLSVIFAIGVLLALSLLGPGSLSIDARVFGRRRVIIPPRPPV